MYKSPTQGKTTRQLPAGFTEHISNIILLRRHFVGFVDIDWFFAQLFIGLWDSTSAGPHSHMWILIRFHDQNPSFPTKSKLDSKSPGLQMVMPACRFNINFLLTLKFYFCLDDVNKVSTRNDTVGLEIQFTRSSGPLKNQDFYKLDPRLFVVAWFHV